MTKTPSDTLSMIIAHPGADTIRKTQKTAEKLGIRVLSEAADFHSLARKLSSVPCDIVIIHVLLPGLPGPLSPDHAVFPLSHRRPAVFYAAPENANPMMLAGFSPVISVYPCEEALSEAVRRHYPPTPSEAELARARNVLLRLGIAQGKALDYLVFASGLCLIRPSDAQRLSRIIYPETARAFGVTEKHVEDAMRRAVDRAFLSGDIDSQYDIFQNTIDETRGKPTLRALLARVTEILRLKEDEKTC